MSLAEQHNIDCFICQKQRGKVAMPGGAIYEEDVVYAGQRA